MDRIPPGIIILPFYIEDIACLFHMYHREQCIFSGSTLSYEGSLTVSGGCPNQRSDNQILDVC